MQTALLTAAKAASGFLSLAATTWLAWKTARLLAAKKREQGLFQALKKANRKKFDKTG